MNTLSPRTTIYKGIEMRSRLEAGFAQWLDQWHFDWEYEPCAFASEDGQYLPDFLLRDVLVANRRGLCDVYVEIKPSNFDAFAQLWHRMRIIKATHADAVLLVQQQRYRPLAFGVNECEWVRCDWVYSWDGDIPKLGLAGRLTAEDRPWPDGFWEGRG